MTEVPTFLDSFRISIEAITQMALIALLGYGFVKRKWLQQSTLNDITRLLIDGIVPCTFIVSMTRGLNANTFSRGYVLSLTVFFWIVGAYLCSRLFYRRFPSPIAAEDRATTAMIIIHNSLYLPLPVALAVTPKAFHDELTVYIAMATMPSMLLQWTLGVNLLSGLKAPSVRERIRLVVNMPMIGFLLGAIFSLLPGFPEAAQGKADSFIVLRVIFSTMNFIGAALSPLAMIMLGAFIGSSSLRGNIKARHVIPLVSRLFLIPILIVIFLQTGIISLPALGALVLILEAAAPPATNHSLIARRYNGQWELVSSLQLVAHAVAFVSLPLWLALALRLYGT